MSGASAPSAPMDPGDGRHLGKAFSAREVSWESGQSGCVDIDIAIMLRDETRKVQTSMYELFAKQSAVLEELQKQISSIAHQQVTAADFSTQILADPAFDLNESPDASRGLKSQDSLMLLGQGKEEEDHLEIKSPGMAIPALEPRLKASSSEAQKHHNQHWVFGAAFKVASSPIFSTFIMLVIAFNLLMMGVEVDATSALQPGEATPPFFLVCNIAIVVIFIFELAIKFLAYGPTGVLLGPEKWWNIFDIIIVITSIIETILDMVTQASLANGLDSSHLRVMRVVRLARALRGIRVMKLIRSIGALRSIVLAIVSTLWSLVWTLVLLVILFYVFGVILAQLVSDGCSTIQADVVNCDSLTHMRYWSTVTESMLTLFLSISGGVSWIEALDPLRSISSLAAFAFIAYVFLSIFAILNVVTGVFCHRAIESAQADKEIAIMKQMEWKESQLRALKGVFIEIDDDGSETITSAELEAAMNKPALMHQMESMDISTRDLRTLFRIMDSDGSGEISFEEFIDGCMHLQGAAQSLQVEDFRREFRFLCKDIAKIGSELSQVRRQLSGQSSTPKASEASRKSWI